MSRNLYLDTEDNPVNYTDPTGHDGFWIIPELVGSYNWVDHGGDDPNGPVLDSTGGSGAAPQGHQLGQEA